MPALTMAEPMPALTDPLVTLRVESAELGLHFAVNLSANVPESRTVQGLASMLATALSTKGALDMNIEEEVNEFNTQLQTKVHQHEERHLFYTRIRQQYERMGNTIQSLKRDYYREIDHLRQQIGRLRKDPNAEVDNVFFFDPDGYRLPAWEDILALLDDKRMQREVLKEQQGPNIQQVPLHMLCQACRNRFIDGVDGKEPMCCQATQTEFDMQCCTEIACQTECDGEFLEESLLAAEHERAASCREREESFIARRKTFATAKERATGLLRAQRAVDGFKRNALVERCKRLAVKLLDRQAAAYELHLQRIAFGRLRENMEKYRSHVPPSSGLEDRAASKVPHDMSRNGPQSRRSPEIKSRGGNGSEDIIDPGGSDAPDKGRRAHTEQGQQHQSTGSTDADRLSGSGDVSQRRRSMAATPGSRPASASVSNDASAAQPADRLTDRHSRAQASKESREQQGADALDERRREALNRLEDVIARRQGRHEAAERAWDGADSGKRSKLDKAGGASASNSRSKSEKQRMGALFMQRQLAALAAHVQRFALSRLRANACSGQGGFQEFQAGSAPVANTGVKHSPGTSGTDEENETSAFVPHSAAAHCRHLWASSPPRKQHDLPFGLNAAAFSEGKCAKSAMQHRSTSSLPEVTSKLLLPSRNDVDAWKENLRSSSTANLRERPRVVQEHGPRCGRRVHDAMGLLDDPSNLQQEPVLRRVGSASSGKRHQPEQEFSRLPCVNLSLGYEAGQHAPQAEAALPAFPGHALHPAALNKRQALQRV